MLKLIGFVVVAALAVRGAKAIVDDYQIKVPFTPAPQPVKA